MEESRLEWVGVSIGRPGVCRDGGQSQRDGKGVWPIEAGILDSLQTGDHP